MFCSLYVLLIQINYYAESIWIRTLSLALRAKAKTGTFQNGGIGKCIYFGLCIYRQRHNQKSKAKPAQKSKKPHHAKTVFTTSHAQHTIKTTKTIFTKKYEFVKQWQRAQLCWKSSRPVWEAAHNYERKNARTAASQIIALPKEQRTVQQRIELAEALIKQFTDEFNFPYTRRNS